MEDLDPIGQATMRKVVWRIIPFIALLYVVSFIDRVNVGFAALAMNEGLGLDYREGRSWRGFHHHACLVMRAFGFLSLEQLRARRGRPRPGKKGELERR